MWYLTDRFLNQLRGIPKERLRALILLLQERLEEFEASSSSYKEKQLALEAREKAFQMALKDRPHLMEALKPREVQLPCLLSWKVRYGGAPERELSPSVEVDFSESMDTYMKGAQEAKAEVEALGKGYGFTSMKSFELCTDMWVNE